MAITKRTKSRNSGRAVSATKGREEDDPNLVQYVYEKRGQGWTFALICREGNAGDAEHFPYAVVQRLGKAYDATHGKPKSIVRSLARQKLAGGPTVIPVRDLRNDSAQILRQVQAGRRFVITVSGHQVAELAPVASKAVFASRSDVESIIREAPLDRNFSHDIEAAVGQRVDEL